MIAFSCSGIVPNADAFEPAFGFLVRQQDIAAIRQLWLQLVAFNIVPSPSLVSTLLASEDVEIVRLALVQLKKLRVEIPWHAIFRHCLERSQPKSLKLLVDRFLPRHTALMNNLLARCYSFRSYQIGIDLFERMLAIGFLPDSITVPIVINLSGAMQNVLLAFRYDYLVLSRHSVVPNLKTVYVQCV